MRLMNFGKEHEIGITLIDKQHKEIIQTVNRLYEIKTHEKKEIVNTLSSLLEQLKTHFFTEEKLMKEKKVVQFISHKLEHDRALSKYETYYNLYKSGNDTFDPEILVSFKNWIQNHLVKKDSKLPDQLSVN